MQEQIILAFFRAKKQEAPKLLYFEGFRRTSGKDAFLQTSKVGAILPHFEPNVSLPTVGLGKRKSPENVVFSRLFWRRERDSNPREIALKLISSQPRYDHFDISPCISNVFQSGAKMQEKRARTY